jgi:hypothetical protein
MVLASPSSGDHLHANSNTKRYKSGNPALLSAHFADAVSPKRAWSAFGGFILLNS